MLDKQLCEIFKVDKMQILFVDYIDYLDDQIESEVDHVKKAKLLHRKKIVNKLRQDYTDLKRS